ncbi:sodium:proton exchanger [Candidatus Uhrbacteria bacterium CG10_big_fil_rev_8_21_14_0_10_50_16]|uniref:Sodium:proton exchanger n=1 Tax=Candidatus Uhrbacteria bacterium CG10_big_fil_rev_8_21_14_0_10_50_16 TaxID=1975039 RepID=A0A2H0RMH8_9BACT|nr:MAG: sodium:proton exchanger [Candidatus Uhrbacteria bacterium CG10_big_fil_rev_8_21_14_0_10_50_16]
MFFQIIILLAGFFALIVGADQLVKGASSIAKRFGFSNLFIGLTVVAFGSSAPELAVNMFAAAGGNPDIAFGNVIGSNLANILLGLGLAALVRPLVVARSAVWREIPFAILGAGVLFALMVDGPLSGTENILSRGEGIALIAFFFVFLYFTIKPMLVKRRESKKDKDLIFVVKQRTGVSIAMIVGGLVGLILGGELIVESASALALSLGFSQAFISLTIVAAGTSLPEIAATMMAAYRGQTDMAIGNIVGSVTFNTLWILGVTAIILPVPVFPGGLIDVFLAFAATAILFPFMINQKRTGELSRWEGALFTIAYVVYLGFTIWRG